MKKFSYLWQYVPELFLGKEMFQIKSLEKIEK